MLGKNGLKFSAKFQNCQPTQTDRGTILEGLDNFLGERMRNRMKFNTSKPVMALVEQEKEVGQQPEGQTD